MPIPKRLSNSFSSFRFSLVPQTPTRPVHLEPGSLSICHSSNGSTPRASSLGSSEKDPKVTVIESNETPPTTIPSPITPWHASYNRNAASAAQETAYLDHTYHLRITRLIVSLLLLSFAATITALNSDILRHYRTTHLPSIFNLNLWPADLNLTPSLLTLITSVIVTLLSLIYLLISAFPSPVPRAKLSNNLFIALTTLSLPLTIATFITSAVLSPAAIFSTFISNTLTTLNIATGPSSTSGLSPTPNGLSAKAETIQSFTCQIVNTAHAFKSDATVLQLPSTSAASDLVPSGFARLCTESRVGHGLVIGLLVLEVVALVVVVAGAVVEKRIVNLRSRRQVASREGEGVPESMVGEKVDV